jgi:hypothetical protein
MQPEQRSIIDRESSLCVRRALNRSSDVTWRADPQQINTDRAHVSARAHRKINAETLLSQGAESHAAVKWGHAESTQPFSNPPSEFASRSDLRLRAIRIRAG